MIYLFNTQILTQLEHCAQIFYSIATLRRVRKPPLLATLDRAKEGPLRYGIIIINSVALA